MAQYTITRTCGHEDTINITGTNVRNQHRGEVRRQERRACLACHTAAEHRAGARVTADLDLPPLTGSTKQIAWAEAIRGRAAPAVERHVEELVASIGVNGFTPAFCDVWIDAMREVLTGRTDARWWIDHSDDAAEAIYRIGAAALRAVVYPDGP
ncbi:hypothetical protein GCM10022243_48850 [Saccharothrix violaceirubra]|uniref:Uncharacterized protein n=1 Tax=Saccharothrix violaceirubra TaxID=413306 RepID=A0A7W7SZG8_9PSEU|nr:hypothetical protein [Saccharothrix violaceirubra]MBB4963773.1 hypothetical protein [Saccharothrix violaceirubra]